MQKRKFLYTLIILVFATCSNAQSLHVAGSFGDFQSAVSFCTNDLNEFYIIDSVSSNIIRIDETGVKQKEAGGFGWDTGVFDSPVSVTSATLQILVTDKNNHRIQLFDRNLILAGIISLSAENLNYSFRYPIGAVRSILGEYFILDSENSQVVVFSPSGGYSLTFGGINSGAAALQLPTKIRMFGENIAVLNAKGISLFDHFGNAIRTIPVPDGTIDIASDNDNIYTLSAKTINVYSGTTGNWQELFRLTDDFSNPRELCLKGNSLYLLSSKSITKFSLGN
ncbi:MAG: hypothetical protein LWX56_08500 [Ignavibacteria bacterium]|nr:hypothetical protein [Ignavibacteria bacterium]